MLCAQLWLWLILYQQVPGSNATSETILMYGHMDKQPPMTEFWNPGTGPHTPVVKDGKLYGRGGGQRGGRISKARESAAHASEGHHGPDGMLYP